MNDRREGAPFKREETIVVVFPDVPNSLFLFDIPFEIGGSRGGRDISDLVVRVRGGGGVGVTAFRNTGDVPDQSNRCNHNHIGILNTRTTTSPLHPGLARKRKNNEEDRDEDDDDETEGYGQDFGWERRGGKRGTPVLVFVRSSRRTRSSSAGRMSVLPAEDERRRPRPRSHGRP